MHNYIFENRPLSLTLVFCFIHTFFFAQSNECPATFVRDFVTSDGQQTVLTQSLTDDIESVLLDNHCTVLLRADHEALDKALNTLAAGSDLTETLRMKLTNSEALRLISGVVRVVNGGDTRISLSIHDLSTNLPAKTKTQTFSELETTNLVYRKAKLAAMLNLSPVDANGGGTSLKASSPLTIDTEEVLWQKIAQKPSEKNVRAYLVGYPDGKYLEKIESMVWGECLSTQKYGKCKTYLKIFPEGAHLQKAQQILANNDRLVEEMMQVPGPRSNSPADPTKILGTKTETSTRGNPNQRQSQPVAHHDIEIVVGPKVGSIAVLPGYQNLGLNTTKDGNQKVVVRLQNGNYELRVYEKNGAMKCNKPFTVRGPLKLTTPCQGQ